MSFGSFCEKELSAGRWRSWCFQTGCYGVRDRSVITQFCPNAGVILVLPGHDWSLTFVCILRSLSGPE